MANRRRGEIGAVIDGRERTLCLTLGALAELEAAFAADDLVALAARFETGKLSARDIARVIGSGLRGGGEAVSDDEVLAMKIDGGVAGFARLTADLLQVSFGSSPAEDSGNSDPPNP